MPFDVLLAGGLGLSILLFALAGGADFGAGFWSLLARRGERAQEQRELIESAIGPVWEANELWIVVSTVILWTAFSPAFAAYGISLFIPFVLAIAGILLRGAFLAFRIEAGEEATGGAYKFFGEIFGSMSIITPFFLGMAAGAIASGRLRLNENELPADGYFQPWLGPFPLIVGILGLATCAYLAAIYLTFEAHGNPPLQEDFRLRGIISGIVLGVLGVIALPITRSDAPYMWNGVSEGLGLALMLVATLSLAISVGLLFVRRYWWARATAILQVTAVFCAWAVAQYPYLLVPDITIQDAASPQPVLVAMSILVVVYVVVLGPSLYFLFRIFKTRSAGREEEP
ncbi:MAG TPA: cytochrome d ubiquinol oxidase subunit II [Rubrobacteraceae bacterium]|nr:cytochrome d ubiquinol oxidase subunit II [Rubrobacteraceae bacterium]